MPKNEFFKRLLFGVWKNIFYRMYGIFFIKPEKDYVNITIFLKTRCGLRQVDMLSNFYNTYGCKYIRKISWVYQISPQPLPPPLPPRHPAMTSRCVKKNPPVIYLWQPNTWYHPFQNALHPLLQQRYPGTWRTSHRPIWKFVSYAHNNWPRIRRCLGRS